MLHAIKFDKENFFTCTDINNKVLETGLTELLFVLTGKGKKRTCNLITVPIYRFIGIIRLLLSCQNDGAIVVHLRYLKGHDVLTGTVYNKDLSLIHDSFNFLDTLKNKFLGHLSTTIRAEYFLDTTDSKTTEMLNNSILAW